MSDREYVYIVRNDSTATAFFMPDGFKSNVTIHLWGGGGGQGYSSTLGGGGAYVTSTLSLSTGDFVEIFVGKSGTNGGREIGGVGGTSGPITGLNAYVSLNGKTADNSAPTGYNDDNNIGAGGGGGGATAVIVNGNVVVAAAGGGGGAGGSGYQIGTVGNPGGVQTSPTGGSQFGGGGHANSNYATGGGGGGGYPSAGENGYNVGDDVSGLVTGRGPAGGQGGYNFGGNTTVNGSGSEAGGRNTTYALTSPPYGNSGYDGYAVLVLERKFNVSVKDSSTFKGVTNAYIKIGPKRDSVTPVTQTFSRTSDSDSEQLFTVPSGVYSVNITHPTPSGLTTRLQAVTPGERIRVSLGNYGQPSTFGSGFTAPAYSKQVFRYRGNVDHLTSMNIQVVAPTGVELNSTGNNATQQSAAAAAGLTFAYTYEGWHGDLSSTINITPAPNNTIFTGVRVVAGGGGRAQGPSVTAQPLSPGYVMSGQIYDTAGGEGYYDINFTLQQLGYLSIQYELPIVISGWAPIKQIWTKVSGQWKSILSTNEINSLEPTTQTYTSLLTNEFVVPAGCTKIYASVTGGGGGGGGDDSYPGAAGFSGSIVKSVINVTPGDVLTIGVGGGGGGGASHSTSGAGFGGSSSLGFGGGRGGNAGSTPQSGAGGGGGAASVLKINNVITAVAAGGGGGAGGGNRGPANTTKPSYANSAAFFGSAGQDKSGDGGGAGGGGGGFFGGGGGTNPGGDVGSNPGSDGSNLVPPGGFSGTANNQGAARVNGRNGSITISYYTP
jgi:hypothetical protein